MNIVLFPPINQLAKFEKKLGDHLSLQSIEEIEDQIMCQTTDKTRSFAVNLIELFENKKLELIDNQVHQLDKAAGPLDRLKLLIPLIGYLEPEEVERRFDTIELDALSADEKIRKAVQKQLEPLRFAEHKPLVKDLAQFTVRAHEIADQVRREHSLAPLQELSPVQLREVDRYLEKPMTPERAAHAIEKYLTALNDQARLAKEVFDGKASLSSLPKEMRLRIDQLIWEAAGGKPSREFIADAILFSLEEKMGMLAE